MPRSGRKEVKGTVRASFCKLVSEAFQGHHFGLDNQKIGQVDHSSLNFSIWDRENIYDFGEV